MQIIFFALIMNIYGNIDYYSMKYNLDKNIIIKMVAAESSFNQKAISHHQAKGLMQLQHATAKEIAELDGFKGLIDLHNNQENIELGCAYMRLLLNKYNQDYAKALAAYNMGSTALKRNGKPYKETEKYINKILGERNVPAYTKRITTPFSLNQKNEYSFKTVRG